MDVGTTADEQADGTAQVVGTLVDAEQFLLEQRGGALLAAVYNLARLAETVDVVGAQGDECHAGGSLVALHGVQHRGGVVHRAVGVYRSAELLVLEAQANAVGKAAAHEEHLLKGFYLELRRRYVYYGAELHQLRLICKPLLESVMSTKRALALRRFSLSMVLIRAAASGSLATM